MFGAIAGGIASALAGGAMSKLFGGGQKAASGGIQGDVLATDNNTVGMGDAGIKSAIQGSNVPNPDEAVPSFVSRSEERFSRNAETDLVCRLPKSSLFPYTTLFRSGIASALAGGAMSKLFGGGQKAASGGIQGDVLATDNNTVGMGDAGIKSAIQGSNVPNPDEAVPSFVSGAMAKAGKGLLEGTLQAGTSAVSDKLLDLVGLGGKSAADKGKDTRDYLAAAFPELNAWERAGADASSA